jgi:menaquinone-9 beta-reductase
LRSEADVIEADLEGYGTIRARYVIGADGMWSTTRKLAGLTEDGYLGEWHAFRQYAANVTGSAAERLWIWFEPDLLPGYAWSFPLPGNRANVGFGVLRDGVRKVRDMKHEWPELLQRPHIAEALGPSVTWPERHTAWPIPGRIDDTVLGSGRVLLVGDAARASDVLTGEGIGQALLTGVLAADAISAHTDPATVQLAYARAVRQHLLADHRMSRLLGRVLAHERGATGSVRLAGASDWTRRNFGRWLFEDEPRSIITTPRRWHRQFLHRSGAFADSPSS